MLTYGFLSPSMFVYKPHIWVSGAYLHSYQCKVLSKEWHDFLFALFCLWEKFMEFT